MKIFRLSFCVCINLTKESLHHRLTFYNDIDMKLRIRPWNFIIVLYSLINCAMIDETNCSERIIHSAADLTVQFKRFNKIFGNENIFTDYFCRCWLAWRVSFNIKIRTNKSFFGIFGYTVVGDKRMLMTLNWWKFFGVSDVVSI